MIENRCVRDIFVQFVWIDLGRGAVAVGSRQYQLTSVTATDGCRKFKFNLLNGGAGVDASEANRCLFKGRRIHFLLHWHWQRQLGLSYTLVTSLFSPLFSPFCTYFSFSMFALSYSFISTLSLF